MYNPRETEHSEHCLPVIEIDHQLQDAANERDIEFDVNIASLTGGGGTMGTVAPLTCRLVEPGNDIALLLSGLSLSIDRNDKTGRLVLPFSANRITNEVTLLAVNTRFWLGSIAANKALKTGYQAQLKKNRLHDELKVIGPFFAGTLAAGLAEVLIPGNPTGEDLAEFIALSLGIAKSMLAIPTTAGPYIVPDEVISYHLRSKRNIREAGKLATRFPVFGYKPTGS